MKTLILILGLSASCFASGPKYVFEDPKMNDELTNVYKDLATILKGSVRISSMTVSSLTVTSAFYYLQTSTQGLSITPFATTGSSYGLSNCKAIITPTSATSRIKVTTTFMLRNSNVAAANAFVSIDRNGTDIGAASNNGFGRYTGSAGMTGVFSWPVSITYIDSPASTSALTYTATIRNDDATTTITLGTTGSQVMILEEIK